MVGKTVEIEVFWQPDGLEAVREDTVLSDSTSYFATVCVHCVQKKTSTFVFLNDS